MEEEMNEAQELKFPQVKFPKEIFTFYLSHPFASRKYVREWELKFEKTHPKIALMNPFYDRSGEGGREDIKAYDEGKEVVKGPDYNWSLVQRDKMLIEFCRGIVGVVDHNSDKSIGTIMEFVYGRNSACNPKLLICTNKNLFNHPWLRTHFHKIYPSFEEFEADVERAVAHVKEKWGF